MFGQLSSSRKTATIHVRRHFSLTFGAERALLLLCDNDDGVDGAEGIVRSRGTSTIRNPVMSWQQLLRSS